MELTESHFLGVQRRMNIPPCCTFWVMGVSVALSFIVRKNFCKSSKWAESKNSVLFAVMCYLVQFKNVLIKATFGTFSCSFYVTRIDFTESRGGFYSRILGLSKLSLTDGLFFRALLSTVRMPCRARNPFWRHCGICWIYTPIKVATRTLLGVSMPRDQFQAHHIIKILISRDERLC